MTILNLHIFQIIDGAEYFWYIATSDMEAFDMHLKKCNMTLEKYQKEIDEKLPEIEIMPNDKILKIYNDAGELEEKTCGEWVKKETLGLLCATCY